MAFPLPTDLSATCDGLLYCGMLWMYNVTNGAGPSLMLGGFAIAMFLATLRYGTARAFGFGGFVGLLGSIWFATMRLMAWWAASLFIIIGAIGIATMILSEK